MRKLFIYGIFLLLAGSLYAAKPVLKTETFELKFAEDGKIASIKFLPDGRELVEPDRGGFNFQVMHRDSNPAGPTLDLTKITLNDDGTMLVGNDDGSRVVTFEVKAHKKHLSFFIKDLKGFPIEETAWLNFRIIPGFKGTEAFSITAMRGKEVTIGMRSLDYMTIARSNTKSLHMQWPHLWRRDKGNPLGGFCIYVCRESETLDTIGEIEVIEGLPHPMHNGIWSKKNNGLARLTQMWFNHKPEEREEALSYFEKAGVRLFYLPQWNWQADGIYQCKKEFWPDGVKSLRAFTDRLRKRGMLVGAHTGSMGIYGGDRVMGGPNMDDRYANWGRGRLAEALTADTTEIRFIPDKGVEKPQEAPHLMSPRPPYYFRHWNPMWLQVGKEVIRIGNIDDSDKSNWKLTGCERGKFSSPKGAYDKGAKAKGLLLCYDSCFGPDVDDTLFNEIADGMAKWINESGLARVSFDAIEFADYAGRWSIGKFLTRVVGQTDHYVAVDTSSGLAPYEWHSSSYMNVGEGMHHLPKAYFESYLVKNCRVSNASFIPAALGAFTFRLETSAYPASSSDEWEWNMSKAGGYNACFFFETGIDFFRKHGETGKILALNKAWEDARMANAFTDEQRERLREYEMNFRLKTGGDKWSVTPVRITKKHPRAFNGNMKFDNPFKKQPLAFEAKYLGGVSNHEKNIPLIPADLSKFKIDKRLTIKTVSGDVVEGKGKKASKKKKDVSIEDYLAVMGTGTGGVGQKLEVRGQKLESQGRLEGTKEVVLLSARNDDKKASGPIQADWHLNKKVNFANNRGIGMWVTGDGKGEYLYIELTGKWNMVRKYVVPIDFKGRKFIVISTGEIGCDYYGLWGWQNGWHSIKLAFRYEDVEKISIGFIGIPPKTQVTCAVEGATALYEQTDTLENLEMSIGKGTLTVQGAINKGEIIVYEGGDTAKILNGNRHKLREVAVKTSKWVAKKGKNTLKLTSKKKTAAPYLMLSVKPVGEPFEIDNPTEKANKVYADIVK